MRFGKLFGKLPYSQIIVKYYREKTLLQDNPKVNIFGNEMFLQNFGYVSISLAKHGWYEKAVTEYVKKTLKQGEWVLDVGANIGYYTLIFASLVGAQGKVFAFEPEPSNFKILSKNTEINGYENIVLENYAVSDKNGSTKLYLSKKSAGSHKIYSSPSVSKENVSVDLISLDSYFFKNHVNPDKISFVKMDVEGSEYGVLKGMKSLLKKRDNLKLILEFDPRQIIEFGSTPKSLVNLLQQYGFQFSIVNNKENYIQSINDTTSFLSSIDKLPGCYLLCVK